MYIAVAKSPEFTKRLSKDDFLALSKRHQKKYLERFPKSSHRHLLEKPSNQKSKGEEPKPFDEPEKKEPKIPRRESLSKLPSEEKTKAVESKALVLHSDAEKKKAKQKDDDAPMRLPARLPPNAHGPRQYPVTTNPTLQEARAERAKEHSKVEQEIRTLNRDGAAVINKHSIKAVAKIEPRHLSTAVKNINENRGEIIDGVAERVQEHPTLFKRGLGALGKVFQGAESLSPKDQRSGKRVLTQVAMVALLGVGVLAMTTGAAPLAVVAGRMLWDIWHGRDKKPKDNGPDYLPNLKKKPSEDEDEEGDGSSDQISAEDFAKGKTNTKKKKKKKGGALPSSKNKARTLPAPSKRQVRKWSEEEAEDAEFEAVAADDKPFMMEQEHIDTIHTVLDQLTDLFKHQSADEFKDLSSKMFAGASGSEYGDADMYRQVFEAVTKLSVGRLSGRIGRNFFGVFRVNIEELAEIVERVTQAAPETEIEDGHTVYHFYNKQCLVTMGRNPGDSDVIHFIFTRA